MGRKAQYGLHRTMILDDCVHGCPLFNLAHFTFSMSGNDPGREG